MRAGEFLRHVRKLARKRGVEYRFVPWRGKGSHGILFYGGSRTTVKDLDKELTKDALHGMLRQLGLTLKDILE